MKRLGKCLLAAWMMAAQGLGSSMVSAQQPSAWPTAPPVPVNQVPAYQAAANQDLSRRLDAYEAELRALRAQLDRQQPAPTRVSFADNGAGDDSLTEIEIQTKPNHKLRGRVYLDEIRRGNTAPMLGTVETGEFGFDTARFGITGNIFESVKYSIEVEFEGNEVDYKDIYVEFQDLAYIDRFRAGFYKVPYGLEELTSSRFDTFMEKSPATTAFSPFRKWSYTAFTNPFDCRDILIANGAFHNDSEDSPGGNQGTIEEGNGDVGFTHRTVWLPFYDEPSGGRYLTHVGGSFLYRNRANDNIIFTDRAQLGSEGSFLAVTVPDDDDWIQMGLEFAWLSGPLHIQSEYFHASTGGALDAKFDSWYVEAGYFLTGENRGYKRSDMAFSRVRPFTNFFSVRTEEGVCRGWGAWQVVARYSHLDLEDAAVGGDNSGELDSFGLGVNWHLNPYSRVMFNWAHNDVERVANANDGTHDMFGARLQFDW